MPIEIKKKGSKFQVVTHPSPGVTNVHAKATSKKNAEAQRRLLLAWEHGGLKNRNKKK